MLVRTLNVGMVLLLLVGTARAAQIFTHNFDMSGDYNQYLVSTTNATVNTEHWTDGSNGYTRYWCPSNNGVQAQVVYGYNLGAAIQSASLYANMTNFSEYGGVPMSLAVSPDNINWTTVFTGARDGADYPFDISNILQGSETAYVRASMYSTGWNIADQFLRTYHDPWGRTPHWATPNVYQFQAAVVPVPSTFVGLAGLAVAGVIGYGVRRRKR